MVYKSADMKNEKTSVTYKLVNTFGQIRVILGYFLDQSNGDITVQINFAQRLASCSFQRSG